MKTNQMRHPLVIVATLLLLLCSRHPLHAGSGLTLASALNTTNLLWTTGGNTVWFPETTNTYDGVAAARSGIVHYRQTNWLQTTVTGPATLSFWTHTQSATNFNAFSWRFTINNSVPAEGPLFRQLPPFSPPWYQQVYDLGVGPNVLRWTASGQATGAETGYICLDEASVSAPRPLTITWQPADVTVYSGSAFVLHAAALGTPPIRYQWRKNGLNIAHATNTSFTVLQSKTNDSGIYSLIVSNPLSHVTSSNAVVTVLPPAAPFFIYEPQSVTAYVGQDIYLSGSVDGSPPFTGVWEKNGRTIPVPPDAYSRPDWFSLVLTNISLANAGTYTLRVTNHWGSVTSTNAVVTVLPPVPPSFTDEPQGVTLYRGQRLYLSADLIGTPPFKYAWKKNGRILLTGTNDWNEFSLTLDNVTSTNAGNYVLCVTNRAGGIASTNAVVTVLPPVPPSFVDQPQSASVYNGQNVRLNAEVTGTPPLTYAWKKDGRTLLVGTNEGFWFSLDLNGVTLTNAGNYVLCVTNGGGGATSTNAVVTVLVPVPPSFTLQPESVTVYSGQAVDLGGEVAGTPPFNYAWQKDGMTVSVGSIADNWFSLILTNVTQADAGNYVLCITNSVGGVASTNAVVTVLPPTAPSFTYEPQSTTVYSGQTVYLAGGVDGSPPFVYAWQKDGTTILTDTNDGNWFSLVLPSVRFTNGGNYVLCVTNNIGGIESTNAVLTVLPPTAPFFRYEPQSITVYSGQEADLYGSVQGSPPFTYTWQKDGVTILTQTSSDNWMPNWSPLILTNVTQMDAGNYTLCVTNDYGGVASTNAVVTVLPPTAPFFTLEPQSVTTDVGQAVYLYGVVNGSPPFTYVWQKDGNTVMVSTSDWTSTSLVLTNVTLTNAGNYVLSVTNSLGGVSSPNAVVTVLPPAPPSFTDEPQSVTVYTGEELDLYGYVNGTPPFTYVWQKDGTTVLVQTNIYDWRPISLPLVLTNVTLANAGTYVLCVTNNYGGIASDNAVVTVLPPTAPFFNLEPHDITAYSGQDVYLNGAVNGSPPFSYVWQKDGVPFMVGTNNSRWFSLPLTTITLTNAGTYVLCVTNNYGGIVSTNAVVIVLTTNALPQLSVSARVKHNLHIKGQRGLRYEVQYSEQLINPQWKTLQTIVLTNENAEMNVPASSGSRFFRLKQTN